MADQIVTDSLIYHQDVPLKQRALHELAKHHWDNILMQEKECVFILRDPKNLIAHRIKILKNLHENIEKLPKLIKGKLINAIFSLQRSHSEAFIWEEKCKLALPFSIFDAEKAGEYQIGNFISKEGHFEELQWAKRFVADETQPLHNRFELACFYCFEKTIERLWRTMKENEQLPCEGRLADIKSKYSKDDLVIIWAYQLENKFDQLIDENRYYEHGFYSSGVIEAISKGHEFAARFFWNMLPEIQKNEFFDGPEFSLLSDAAEANHCGLVHFFYLLLRHKQRELIAYTVRDGNQRSPTSQAPILCCLLQSQYYISVLEDMVNPSVPIPVQIYKWLLTSLSFDLLELQNPEHEAIFKGLWNYLSEEMREQVLDTDSFIIRNLVKIRAMDLLKRIIQPMNLSEKNGMLLNDAKYAGVSALDDFSYYEDFDALRRYLLFFPHGVLSSYPRI